MKACSKNQRMREGSPNQSAECASVIYFNLVRNTEWAEWALSSVPKAFVNG